MYTPYEHGYHDCMEKLGFIGRFVDRGGSPGQHYTSGQEPWAMSTAQHRIRQKALRGPKAPAAPRPPRGTYHQDTDTARDHVVARNTQLRHMGL
jgi:hypothetical protein